MARKSLGVILHGAPHCIQHQTIILKILNFICRYGSIMSVASASIAFIMSIFSTDNVPLLTIWIALIVFGGVMGVFLLPLRFLWSKKYRCPYCGHFFTQIRVSDYMLVDSYQTNVSRDVEDHASGTAFDLNGNVTFIDITSKHTEQGVETTETYTYNMGCTCCRCVHKLEKKRSFQNFG